MTEPAGPDEADELDNLDDEGGIGPYLAVVLAAVVIGVGLALYVAGYRDEILAILTQSPT
jgi:hypothetical protein